MSCACISGARQVKLEFDAMEQSLSEDLSSLPYWSRCNDKVWSVEVGGQSGYRTPEDIANFLTVVRGLVQIAHDCDQWILAEGIETEQELNLMRDLGVDLFQGFYLASPGTLAPRQLSISHE